MQRGPHVGHDVAAIHQHGTRRAIAQRDVEDGPMFRGVDRCAGKHLVPLPGNAGSPGELLQEGHHAVVDGAFGIIHQQVVAGCAEP